MILHSGIQNQVYQHTAIKNLTVKTPRSLVWVANSTVFLQNSDCVEEILIPETDQIISSKRQQFLHWREQIIPVYQVSELLSYTNPRLEVIPRKALAVLSSPDLFELILVLNQGQQTLALKTNVEHLIADTELVIEPFGLETTLPSYVYGYTICQDLSLPVIDVIALLDQTIAQSQIIAPELSHNSLTPAITTTIEPIVLVVDDSKTVQQIVSLTLQRAGYQVLQANNGQEAIAQLLQNPSIQAVVCDIEMPHMNGFEFLGHRLQDSLLAKLPVIMLSSCSGNKYRQLAMQLGATSYLTKPYVQQEFLATLKMVLDKES